MAWRWASLGVKPANRQSISRLRGSSVRILRWL